MLNGASPSGPARGKSDAAGVQADQDLKHRLATTAVLLAFAVVAIAMATFAWFSIADSAKTRMLAMDATADGSLRFDLDAHDDFESYVHTLGFDAISSRISSDLGVDIDASKLEPVTTSDYETFTLEDGSVAQASSGSYLEFTLHFISQKEVVVRLTEQDGSDDAAGTAFSSAVDGLPLAMRMSFTADGQTWVYDPNVATNATSAGAATVFGLDKGETTEASSMFDLVANTDKSVIVRIWLEGTDANCTNMMKGADYSVSMALALSSRHSSCAQFSAASRIECRQVTPCRASSASGTKAGATSKTHLKLRALSLSFCPKGRRVPPLESR